MSKGFPKTFDIPPGSQKYIRQKATKGKYLHNLSPIPKQSPAPTVHHLA